MQEAVLLNIGNSISEIAFWDGERINPLQRLKTSSLSETMFLTPIIQQFGNHRFLAACVVPSVKNFFIEKFPEISIIWLSADLPLGLDLSQIEKSTLGADRLANAVAAIHTLTLPAIILDCGTAITTEVIDKQKRLLGGMIAPGRQLARWALKRGTGQLPEVELSQELPPAIGKNTQQAIKSGVDLGLLGGIELILLESRKMIGDPELRATVIGGDRGFFARNLTKVRVGPENFTLKGLALVAEML